VPRSDRFSADRSGTDRPAVDTVLTDRASSCRIERECCGAGAGAPVSQLRDGIEAAVMTGALGARRAGPFELQDPTRGCAVSAVVVRACASSAGAS